MLKKLALAGALCCALIGSAWAQSSPGFVTGQVPSAAQWNSYFAGKVDVGGVGNVTASMLASGAAAGNLGFTPARVINVMDASYGAKGDGATDDTAAFALAIAAVNASASSGQAACLTIPKGVFYINGSALPAFTQNTGGGICGAGSWKSIIEIGTSYSGDLFSWSDAWGAGTNPSGNVITVPQKYGVRVTGLTILGNNTSASQQNAIMLYDHEDFVIVDDVDIENLNGRGIYAGAIKNDTASYIRESHFNNIRIFNSGATSAAAFEITSQCTALCTGQDASNEIDIANVDVYGSRGPSFVLRNANPSMGGSMRQIRMSQIRVEGSEGNPNSVVADLMTIGDAAMSGPMANIACNSCELVSPYTNYPAFHITGTGVATAPYAVAFRGMISTGGGGGAGVLISAGSNIALDFNSLSSGQTNITVASSTYTGGPIIIDGNGAEVNWSWNVDATALQYVSNRRWVFGVPTANSATMFASLQRPDNTVNFGNNRGANSTDWQTTRYSSIQVASGSNSTISGGANNQASGLDSVVAGGNNNANAGYRGVVGGGYGNTLSGNYSVIPGGLQAQTFGNTGMMAFASGQIATQGDAEIGWQVLRGTGASTSAIRLTSDGSGANSINCVNPPNNMAFALVVSVVAYDHTTIIKNEMWSNWSMLLTRGANAAATTLAAASTPTPLTNGTLTGSAIAVSADTTSGCLNVSFTPPTSNTDTWNVVAKVQIVAVQ